MSAPQDKHEILNQRIGKLTKQNSDNIFKEFQYLVTEIKRLEVSNKLRNQLFEKLEISFTSFCALNEPYIKTANGQHLLLSFFENFAAIKQKYHVVFQHLRFAPLNQLVKQIDFSQLKGPHLHQVIRHLSQFGLPQLPHEQSFQQELLNRVLLDLSPRKYVGEEWVKRSMHNLVHCKNCGLLSRKNLTEDNVKLLDNIISQAANFITENEITFEVEDAQAAIDCLDYTANVLGRHEHQLATQVLTPLIQHREDYSSQAHRDIFGKICKFLENKKGGEYDWKHNPLQVQNGFIYGDVISIKIEEYYSEHKKADIVFLLNGKKVLLVIEVDGDSHFFTSEVKTGATRARNELIEALLKEGRFLQINSKDFDTFRSLKQLQQQTVAEFEFLNFIQKFLQDELAKYQAEPKEKEVVAKDKTKKEETAETEQTAKKTKVPKPDIKQKSRAQIKQELLGTFFATLQDPSLGNIEDILSDLNFEASEKSKLLVPGTDLNPFDFVLQKFNSTKSAQTEYANLLQVLWIFGFECQKKELIDKSVSYPPELDQALGKASVKKLISAQDLQEVIRKAKSGNFMPAQNLLTTNTLPEIIDEELEESLAELFKATMLHPQKSRKFFEQFHESPWFIQTKEDLLVNILLNADVRLAKSFLSTLAPLNKDFLPDFFRRRKSQLSKIYDFADSSLMEEFEKAISTDAELAAQAFDESTKMLANLTIPASAVLHVAKRVLESDKKTPTVLCCKAILYGQGILVDKNEKKARQFLLKASNDGRVNKDPSILLANLYKHEGNTQKAMEIYTQFLSEDHDGSIHFTLSQLVDDHELKFKYYRTAANLGSPEAMIICGLEYCEGIHGIKRDRDKAVELFKTAASKGCADGLAHLGMMYLRDEIKGEKDGRSNATELFYKAAQNRSSVGAFNYAVTLVQKPQPEYREALKYLTLAKEFQLPFPSQEQQADEMIKQIRAKLNPQQQTPQQQIKLTDKKKAGTPKSGKPSQLN